ncbi:MAG: DUF2071 domain-containing protein [Trueperaceae bacterium]
MRPFLSADWRHLLMLNYAVDPDLLRPFVPRGTELDAWGGTCYVSVVGFLMRGTRVLGVPVPFHRDFEEVNLRFYVRRRAPEGWRRGVVFVQEIVPRRAIAAVARLRFNEPYRAMPMRHRIDATDGELRPNGTVAYEWRLRGRWHALRGTVTGSPQRPEAGSEHEFITEHHWGYTAQRDGGSLEYLVEHDPWRVWSVHDALLDCDVSAVYGSRFAGPLQGPARSAFVAEGSPVVVHRGVRI